MPAKVGKVKAPSKRVGRVSPDGLSIKKHSIAIFNVEAVEHAVLQDL